MKDFSEILPTSWIASNALAFATQDAYPITPGHTLVIPHRVVPTWFEATREEQLAILDLIDEVKLLLDERFAPAGYNVGFNAGIAAGQTVMHLHVHVIPRYPGDTDDPTGGVRHVIPWKANYLRAHEAGDGPGPDPLATGTESDPFLAHLRPIFPRSTEIAIVAAFVQDSGLELLKGWIASAIARGARIRLVTGDYLNITQAAARRRMLDWQQGLAQKEDAGDGDATEREGVLDHAPPAFAARVVETCPEGGRARSFHPKSWRFEGPGFGVAFVGSSNISDSALRTGVEWNLRVDRERDPFAYARIRDEFELLWGRALPLTPEWVDAYEKLAREARWTLPPGEAEPEAPVPVPTPHETQREALVALAAARRGGRTRALVVMATGLGKTLLAAFDAHALRAELEGGLPAASAMAATPARFRVLFLAHRRELLFQAAEVFRRVLGGDGPGLRVGWFAEDRSELAGDLVVASVQKLSRARNLLRLALERFDYVIIDEVHHAHAPSYRKILDRVHAGFLLGLTATPNRTDAGDILGLFDDFVAFEAGLGVGIQRGRLVPFAYYGVKDDIEYENIPWRNGRFDPEVLASAVQTAHRMERLWEAMGDHPGSRTLVFCCSISHARFVRSWLSAQGVRVAAVFGAPDSADRSEALTRLERGELDAVCAGDLFNEGIDVPPIDRVIMLRPTVSPVLFLQQLGRGLRVADGKCLLTVIDFVGNHRVFLGRLRALLSLGGRRADLRRYLETGRAANLPEGCSAEIELQAIELLRALLPRDPDALKRAFLELCAARGERPMAGELYRAGYSIASLRRGEPGGWFRFIEAMGHATVEEQQVLEAGADWFVELETTAMTKCFKMVTLEVLIEAGGLLTGMPLHELAARSYEILARSPELLLDLHGVKQLPDPHRPDPVEWAAYWRKNPVAAWCGGFAKPGAEAGNGRWFRVEDERLVPRFAVAPELEATFTAMTRELVDYRLAQYRRRRGSQASDSAFVCKVISNQRDPILKLPDGKERERVPEGDTEVRLPEGEAWLFRMQKIACNVARPVGTDRNQLPDLLRRWFGPAAGQPGTAFRVRFVRLADGWTVEPLGAIVESIRNGWVVAFPTYQAAADSRKGRSLAEPLVADAPPAEAVEARAPEPVEYLQLPEALLPGAAALHGAAAHADPGDLFAIQAVGDSMDGGEDPIRDGDWLVFRWARSKPSGAVEGRVVLVESASRQGGRDLLVKRLVRDGGGWVFRSDKASHSDFPATDSTTVLAVLCWNLGREPGRGDVVE